MQKDQPISQQKQLFKAAVFKPANLLVLGIGIVAGKFSYMLIPVGAMAYGILCYLDVSSAEFAERVLGCPLSPPSPKRLKPSSGTPGELAAFQAADLTALQQEIFNAARKIQRIYQQSDDLTHELLGGVSDIDGIIAKSDVISGKAQKIQDYLLAENLEHAQQGVLALEQRIAQADDDFSKQQYQQALEAKQHHLATIKDLRQMYGRLVSQLTNISVSLDSMSSKMMKLTTMGQTLTSVESEQVVGQLRAMLEDMEQLDTVLNEHLSLHAP